MYIIQIYALTYLPSNTNISEIVPYLVKIPTKVIFDQAIDDSTNFVNNSY